MRILRLFIVVLVASLLFTQPILAAVNWDGTPVDPDVPLAFEDPANWDTSTYDPPPSVPETTPPGDDSIWFVNEYNGSILLSAERSGNNGTDKLGPFRVGGGVASEVAKLIIANDVTFTGNERDETGEVSTNIREIRIGGDDTTPGDSSFPLGIVQQTAGHVWLEYLDDPSKASIKLTADKVATGGAVWEVGGTAQLTALDLLCSNKSDVVGTGSIFRIRGSNVVSVQFGDRVTFESQTAHWDLTDVDYGSYVQKQANRGKSILEFVLDAGGVTPLESADNVGMGSLFTDPDTLDSWVVPGFLRVKLSEPTTAGSGALGSGNEEVLVKADRLSSGTGIASVFPDSQSAAGVFFDPDRDMAGYPHRVIERDPLSAQSSLGTVISEYAGVTYTWTANYDDNGSGVGTIEDAFVLSDLVISDPGGSGIQGDFDDLNGLDVADANALQNSFGIAIAFDAAQNMYDLNADGEVDELDLAELITHAGFANTSMADFDLDGTVGASDLSTLQANLGTTSGALWSEGDADLDGDVDLADIMEWQRGATATPSLGVVPEPCSVLLLASAAAVLGLRRNRKV